MFEEPDMCMEYVMGVLMIEKIVYDHTGKHNSMPLDSDAFPETYYEALSSISDKQEMGSDERWDCYVTKICFPDMPRYYQLCKEYGRKHQLSLKNNPYFKDAKDFVDIEMNSINSFCIDHKLCTPKKETAKRYSCLIVFTTIDFNQEVQEIEALYNIRKFYSEGVSKLEKELGLTKSNIVEFPVIKTERSVAA